MENYFFGSFCTEFYGENEAENRFEKSCLDFEVF